MALLLTDASSNANDLTNGNSTSDITTGLPSGSGHAAGFVRASSNYLKITTPNASMAMTAAVTIMARLRLDALPASGTTYQILANWYDTENHYMLRFDNEAGTQKLNMYVSNGTSFDKFSFSHAITADGLFHTFSGAWQGSDKAYELIIDDVSKATGNGVNVVSMPSNQRSAVIGANNVPTPSDDFATFTLDYVRIFAAKLSLATQQAQSANKFITSGNSIAGSWPFETSLKTANFFPWFMPR